MSKETILELVEALGEAYVALEEKDARDAEIAEVRRIANKLMKDLNKALLDNNQLKKENHILQVFIEEHVDEEKKKLIFKD